MATCGAVYKQALLYSDANRHLRWLRHLRTVGSVTGPYFFAITANWLSAGESVTGPCFWPSGCNLQVSLGGISTTLPSDFREGSLPFKFCLGPASPPGRCVVLPLILFLLIAPTPRGLAKSVHRGSTARAFQFPSSAVPALLSLLFRLASPQEGNLSFRLASSPDCSYSLVLV